MKHLFLVTALLVASLYEATAQKNKKVDIISFNSQQSGTVEKVKNDTINGYQFTLRANEETDINLKFILKKEGKLTVMVHDKMGKLLHKKRYTKSGVNALPLDMQENEEFIVSLTDGCNSEMVVSLLEALSADTE